MKRRSLIKILGLASLFPALAALARVKAPPVPRGKISPDPTAGKRIPYTFGLPEFAQWPTRTIYYPTDRLDSDHIFYHTSSYDIRHTAIILEHGFGWVRVALMDHNCEPVEGLFKVNITGPNRGFDTGISHYETIGDIRDSAEVFINNMRRSEPFDPAGWTGPRGL